MIAELKRCPFCDGRLEFKRGSQHDASMDFYEHPTNDCTLANVDLGDTITVGDYPEAIEAWNRRATQANVDKADALHDSAYIAGLNEGFRYGERGDPHGLQKLIEARAGYLKPLKAASPANTAAATGDEQAAYLAWWHSEGHKTIGQIDGWKVWQAARARPALTDEQIIRMFYPIQEPTANARHIALAIGRAIERHLNGEKA